MLFDIQLQMSVLLNIVDVYAHALNAHKLILHGGLSTPISINLLYRFWLRGGVPMNHLRSQTPLEWTARGILSYLLGFFGENSIFLREYCQAFFIRLLSFLSSSMIDRNLPTILAIRRPTFLTAGNTS